MQSTRSQTRDIAQCRTAGKIRNYERDLPQRDERLGQPFGELNCSLCADVVKVEAASGRGKQVILPVQVQAPACVPEPNVAHLPN